MAAKRKPTAHQEHTERLAAGRETTQRWGIAGSVIVRIAYAAAAVGCVYFLAGQETVIKGAIELVFKADFPQWLAGYGLAAVCGSGWYRERKLRNREVEALSANVKRHEILIDAKRSTSALSSTGEPPKLLGDGKAPREQGDP